MMSSLVNALDALSAAHAINYKKLVQLSTQQVYDCGQYTVDHSTNDLG